MCRTLNIPHNFSEFVYRLVRGILYAFTFILCVLGLSMIIFSFWYIYEGKNYHLDIKIKTWVFSISFLTGLILFVLSVFGLTGVLRESLFLTKTFLVGMSLLVLSELACIFLIYFYRQHILDHASVLFQKLITHYTEDDDVRGLVDKIQSEMKCCGISSANDWNLNSYYNCSSVSSFACSVPPSCCFNFKTDSPKVNMFCGLGVRQEENLNKMFHLVHTSGCKFAINSFLDYKHQLTASISIGFLVPQIIAIILVITFISILHFLIIIESEQTEQFFGQFRQNNYDLKNLSNFIKHSLRRQKPQLQQKPPVKQKSNEVKIIRSNTDIYHIYQ